MRCSGVESPSAVGSPGVVARLGVVVRAGVIVRVLVAVLGLVVLVGCQPEPKSPYDYTLPPSTTGTPAINELPENSDENDYYPIATRTYIEFHLAYFSMQSSGDYANPPPQIDEIVKGEYRQTVQKVIDASAQSGYLVQGEFTHRDIRTRTSPEEIPEGADYVLEACRDYTKVAVYDGAGAYLGQAPIRYDVSYFQVQDDRMVITGGTTEKVDECPF